MRKRGSWTGYSPARERVGGCDDRNLGRRQSGHGVVDLRGSVAVVIAPRLAARLDLPFADRLIPARDAPAVTVPERLSEEERDRQGRTSFFRRLAEVTGALNFPVPRGEDLRDRVREQVEASIVGLAQTTGAVILGRAAAVVLAGHPGSFHIRLDGPKERRAVRGQELEKVTLDAARLRLEETDRARARYVSRQYGRDPSDPSLYHLRLDSTVFSVEACVELLAGAAKAFWQGAGGPDGSDRP